MDTSNGQPQYIKQQAPSVLETRENIITQILGAISGVFRITVNEPALTVASALPRESFTNFVAGEMMRRVDIAWLCSVPYDRTALGLCYDVRTISKGLYSYDDVKVLETEVKAIIGDKGFILGISYLDMFKSVFESV